MTIEVDSLVAVLISAIPDMETSELVDLEIAVNAEIQDRYRNSLKPVKFCDCDLCEDARRLSNGF